MKNVTNYVAPSPAHVLEKEKDPSVSEKKLKAIDYQVDKNGLKIVVDVRKFSRKKLRVVVEAKNDDTYVFVKTSCSWKILK